MRDMARCVVLAILVMGCGDDGGSVDAAPEQYPCDETLDGCRCDIGQTDILTECSEESVASAGSEAYCCEGGGTCQCVEVECWMSGGGCHCGSSYVVGGLGAQVASCDGTYCCLDEGGSLCMCSVLECDSDETEVASCDMSMVQNCRLDFEERVASCLP